MPNYPFLTVLTAALNSLSVLVGGGWCCYHFPLAHLRLRRYSRLFHNIDHLTRHQNLRRSCGAVPLSFWDRVPCSCPSVPRRIPNLRHHQTLYSVMGPWITWKTWCILSLNLNFVPAQAHVSACRTWFSLPLRVSGVRSPYYPPQRRCGGSPNVPPLSYLQVSP